MGDIIEAQFPSHNEVNTEPVEIVDTGIIDSLRFERLRHSVALHAARYDARLYRKLVCYGMATFARHTNEQMIELINNPRNERDWADKPITWGAIIAVVRLRRLFL